MDLSNKFRSLTNPVVKGEQTPFVNRKADGQPEAKATIGSVDFSFSLTLFHGICQRTNDITLWNKRFKRL